MDSKRKTGVCRWRFGGLPSQSELNKRGGERMEEEWNVLVEGDNGAFRFRSHGDRGLGPGRTPLVGGWRRGYSGYSGLQWFAGVVARLGAATDGR